MKKHYVYKTVNKVTGQFYVGVHSTADVEDGYIGTGNRIKAAKRKYGVAAFFIESRIICDTAEEAYEIEALLVDATLLENPLCYNLAPGGRGSERRRQRKPYTKRKGVPHTEASRAAISKAKSKTSPKTAKRMSESAKARIVIETCPACGHQGTAPNIKRWHFSNCKRGVF